MREQLFFEFVRTIDRTQMDVSLSVQFGVEASGRLSAAPSLGKADVERGAEIAALHSAGGDGDMPPIIADKSVAAEIKSPLLPKSGEVGHPE